MLEITGRCDLALTENQLVKKNLSLGSDFRCLINRVPICFLFLIISENTANLGGSVMNSYQVLLV